MLGFVGVNLRQVLYPSDGELLNEGMHILASFTTHRPGEKKRGVNSGERAPIPVFLTLDYVREVVSCIACCIFQIGAGARVNVCVCV